MCIVMCYPLGRDDFQDTEGIRGDIPDQVGHLFILLSICLTTRERSPRVTGLSRDAIFGIPMPFDLPTCKFRLAFEPVWFSRCHFLDATLFFLSSQFEWVLNFFLSRSLRNARERAYDQTIASRGKGPDFWGPYVEEWENPPRAMGESWLELFFSSAFGRAVVNGVWDMNDLT